MAPVVTEDSPPPPHPPSGKLVAGIADSTSAIILQEADVSSSEELLPSSEEPISASPGASLHSTIGDSLCSFSFSEELVADAAESASAQTLREPDVSPLELLNSGSSDESITACSHTAPHNTMDGSVSTSPFKCDKIVAGTTESSSSLTLQETDISSYEALLDTTASEEPITSSPGMAPHSTTDGSSIFPPVRLEKFTLAGAAESASGENLQEPYVSTLELPYTTASSDVLSTANSITVLHDTTDNSPPSAPFVGPPILFRRPEDWYQTFYMRVDCEGRFHMYPDLGGPFHSSQEAQAVIDHYLKERRLPEICEMPSEGPLVEWRIKRCLYYPDGTPKRGPESPACKNPRDQQRQFAKALLDQYNDYHNLCKDLAHELKDLVSFQWIYEKHETYYHFNFTTKTKADDGDGNLFFAETWHKRKERVWMVTCCCMIEPNDAGLCCGCCRNGRPEMRHPNNTRAFIGGHVKAEMPFGGDDSSDEEDDEAYVARLRFIFGGR